MRNDVSPARRGRARALCPPAWRHLCRGRRREVTGPSATGGSPAGHARGGARRPIAANALLWLLLASLAVSSARAATLELVPSATALQPGDTLTVDVVVGGLGEGGPPSLGSFDLTLAFDPAVLGYTGATPDAGLGDAAQGEATGGVAPATGGVNVYGVSLLTSSALDAGQAGRFRLFSVSFDALANGMGGLGLTGSILGSAAGPGLAIEDVIAPAVRVGAAAPAGGAAPIPALSAWALLLLFGVLSALGLRRLRGGLRP